MIRLLFRYPRRRRRREAINICSLARLLPVIRKLSQQPSGGLHNTNYTITFTFPYTRSECCCPAAQLRGRGIPANIGFYRTSILFAKMKPLPANGLMDIGFEMPNSQLEESDVNIFLFFVFFFFTLAS